MTQIPPPMIARLEAEWRADMSAIGADSTLANGAFEDILARHSEAHRRYHGLSHLVALFDLIGSVVAAGSAARLAVWWHDAIYDPKASDNEEQSAHLARCVLPGLRASQSLVDETADLILKTKKHWDSGGAGVKGDTFLDADIAILGAPSATYDAYARGVREECVWAPETLYKQGRSAFLRGAVARDRLFRTDAFESAYAAQARENMTRELAALEAGA